MAAAGVVMEGAPRPVGAGVEHQVFHLWPENLPSFQLWLSVQTQWMRDFGARTGLNYASITAGWLTPHQCRRRRLPLERALDDLKAMEQGALVVWAEQQQQEKEKAK